MWYSKSACGHRNGLRLRIFGTYGSAEWYQMEPEKLIVCDNKGNIQIVDRASNLVEVTCLPRYNRFKAGHPAGFIEAFANLYEDIAEALTNYNTNTNYLTQYTFGIDDALNGLIFLKAIHKSFIENKIISIDEM
jgi:predicted dehydrogenase